MYDKSMVHRRISERPSRPSYALFPRFTEMQYSPKNVLVYPVINYHSYMLDGSMVMEHHNFNRKFIQLNGSFPIAMLVCWRVLELLSLSLLWLRCAPLRCHIRLILHLGHHPELKLASSKLSINFAVENGLTSMIYLNKC